jgi:ubiquitin C-terminal hydrolase
MKALDAVEQLCLKESVDFGELERLCKLVSELMEQFFAPSVVSNLKVIADYSKLRKPVSTLIMSSLPRLVAEHSQERVDRLLLPSILVMNFCHFLRKLQVIVTRFRESLVARNLAAHGSDVYKELLPAGFHLAAPTIPDAPSSSSTTDGCSPDQESYFPSDMASLISNALHAQTEAFDDKTLPSYSSELNSHLPVGVPRGLPNLGNTCFINTALQLLASISEFRDLVAEAVSNHQAPAASDLRWYLRKSPEALLRCLNDVLLAISGRIPAPNDREVCERLCAQMALHTDHFQSLQEGDAYEWISALVDLLGTHVAPLQATHMHQTACSVCKHIAISKPYQAIASLPINLPQAEDTLQVFSFQQLLRDAAESPIPKWFCNVCKDSVRSLNRAYFSDRPRYVLCNLARFQENGTINKTRVGLSPVVDLSSFMRDANTSADHHSFYELIGIGHYENFYCRHWKAQIYCPAQEKWHTVDDKSVTANSAAPWTDSSPSATLLLYKLCVNPPRLQHDDKIDVPTAYPDAYRDADDKPLSRSESQPEAANPTEAQELLQCPSSTAAAPTKKASTAPKASDPSVALPLVPLASSVTPDPSKTTPAASNLSLVSSALGTSTSSPSDALVKASLDDSATSVICGSDEITVSALHISGALEKIQPATVQSWLKARFKLEVANIYLDSSGGGFFVQFSELIQQPIKLVAFKNPPKIRNIPVSMSRCLVAVVGLPPNEIQEQDLKEALLDEFEEETIQGYALCGTHAFIAFKSDSTKVEALNSGEIFIAGSYYKVVESIP